jgi:hypothetical protein
MAQTPNQLTIAAKCFSQSIPKGDQWGVLIYLFNIVSGMNLTPKQLQSAAACYTQSIPRGDQLGVLVYLANVIAAGGGTGGGVGAVLSGTQQNPNGGGGNQPIVPVQPNAAAIYYQDPLAGTGSDWWQWDIIEQTWVQFSV